MQQHKRKPSVIAAILLVFILGVVVGKLLPSSLLQLTTNSPQPTTYNPQPTPILPIVVTSESTLSDIIVSTNSKTGDRFDESFLHALATLEQTEKEIASDAVRLAEHPDIKSMAQEVLNTTDKLINAIQTLQFKWDYTKGRM